jgi:arylformamidase
VTESGPPLHDISIPVSADTAEWPGDTAFACGWTARLADGSSVNLSSFTMSPHVGTHADAPLHVRDGAPGSHELPLAAFVGAARLISITGAPRDVALSALLDAGAGGAARVLLRTGAPIAGGSFPPDWPALEPGCARTLVARGLTLLGVDCPSVDRRHSTTLDVHHALFDGGAYVLENLDLRGVPDGEYELVALPLALVGLDGAPVRAALRRVSSRTSNH